MLPNPIDSPFFKSTIPTPPITVEILYQLGLAVEHSGEEAAGAATREWLKKAGEWIGFKKWADDLDAYVRERLKAEHQPKGTPE